MIARKAMEPDEAQFWGVATSRVEPIAPVSGWALNEVAALDRHAPGLAGSFLRASAERRQVVAALLASRPMPTSSTDASQLAEFIRRTSHREMLLEAFGAVPEGLRGALGRSGAQPHQRAFYRMLFRLLSSPAKRTVAAVIKRLDRIDLIKLRIAQCLPPDIRTANLVKLLATAQAAKDVAKLLDLLSTNGIDRAVLCEALRRVTSAEQLPCFWARWSEKLVFPQHPVPASKFYTPITDGAALRVSARRLRNCSRRYIAELMRQESAFAEVQCAGHRGVVHLRREHDRWTLEGLFGKHNVAVAPELREAATGYLRMHGVQTNERSPERGGEWRVLRRAIGVHILL